MATRKPKATTATTTTTDSPALQFVPLRQIFTLPQVRTDFNEDTLAELAESLKKHGMLQPVLLRPQVGTMVGDSTGNADKQLYLVIAGERRIRAANLAGLEAVPAIIGQADDETASTMQLVENIQREDLSLKDTAAGVLMLYERHKKLDAVAAIVKKSVPWVSKHISVATKLSRQAQQLLDEGHTEDLELLMTVSQIANLANSYPRLDQLIEKIEKKKAGRKEARALLETLRKEIEQAKAERKGKGSAGQQGELSINEEQRRKEPEWQPGNAVAELHDVLLDQAHPPVEELLKVYDDKQQKAMASIPPHMDAWRMGLAHAGQTSVQCMRAMAGLLAHGNLVNDPFDMAAFILGTLKLELSLRELMTEVHHIMHG